MLHKTTRQWSAVNSTGVSVVKKARSKWFQSPANNWWKRLSERSKIYIPRLLFATKGIFLGLWIIIEWINDVETWCYAGINWKSNMKIEKLQKYHCYRTQRRWNNDFSVKCLSLLFSWYSQNLFLDSILAPPTHIHYLILFFPNLKTISK